MRAYLAALGLAAACVAPGHPGMAADLPTSDRSAVEQVIRQQFDAFAHDDAAAAFALASPGIQQMMGNPEHFMALVRHAYQPVYAPRSTEFTQLSDDSGTVTQSVELIGPDGLAYTALYSMEREADGTWRIAGCILLESKRLGV